MTRENYHHGDLRAALIDEALGLIERSSLDDLSLREVARNVGVSATAVYRHFPSKDDLLKALALHGLGLLGEQQRKAAARTDGSEAFAQTGRAYVRFALNHPNLFRLIFIHSPSHMQPSSSSPEGSAAWLRTLCALLETAYPRTELEAASTLRVTNVRDNVSLDDATFTKPTPTQPGLGR